MRMQKSRRGTDKPIEIFIALFIILAIAMLMLRMFSDQLREKQQELKKQEYQQQLEFAKKEAQQECGDVCADALSNGCDMQSQVRFCLHEISGGMDLDADGEIRRESYSEEYTVGACEEHVYCPLIETCKECGRSLDFTTCFEIVCDYFYDLTGDPVEAAERMGQRFSFGSCLTQQEWDASLTWDQRLPAEQIACCNRHGGNCGTA